MTALAAVLLWLSGAATGAALLMARDRWWRRGLPPASRRQIRAARAAQRLPIPKLYHRDLSTHEDTR